MSTALFDRILETSTTTGTGALDLNGPAAGYRGFAAAVGTNLYYVVEDGTDWECGIGHVQDLGGGAYRLVRDTVTSSSNSGSLVSFGGGTKRAYCDATAEALKIDNLLPVLTDPGSVLRNDGSGAFWGVGAVIWQGAWSSGTSYKVNDSVTYNNSSYICKAPNSNAQPDVNGSFWDVIAVKGTDGADGAAGQGVPTGGSTGQYLTKNSGTDYDTHWTDLPGAPGVGGEVLFSSGGAFAADATFNYGSGTLAVGSVELNNHIKVPELRVTSNTATASTLGSVVRYVTVFDGNGTVLGYLPVYDSIS
jgi:hypothetical protein